MMDHFKEDIVSPRAKVLSNVLYVLCWVFIVLFGGYALMQYRYASEYSALFQELMKKRNGGI